MKFNHLRTINITIKRKEVLSMMFFYPVFGFMGLFMIIFWGAIIWLIISLVRGSSHRGMGECSSRKKVSADSAMDILRERYAKGEITKEEFEEKKQDLRK